jgi:hypothetical protein
MTSATLHAPLLATLVMFATGCGSGCAGSHGGGAHSASSSSGSSHSYGGSSHSSSSYGGSSHSSSSYGGSSRSSTASNSRSGSGSQGSRGSRSGSRSGGAGAAGDSTGWDGTTDPADYGYSVPPAPVGYGRDDLGPPPPARAETPCQRAQREWLEQHPGLPRPYVLRCGPLGEWGSGSPNAQPDPSDLPL